MISNEKKISTKRRYNEKVVSRHVDRAEALYKLNLRKSSWNSWCNPGRKLRIPLKPSYAYI